MKTITDTANRTSNVPDILDIPQVRVWLGLQGLLALASVVTADIAGYQDTAELLDIQEVTQSGLRIHHHPG